MFKFAQEGIVTWPVTLPVDTEGNIVDTVIKVRLRPLTRKELRAIDRDSVQQRTKQLAETLADVMAPPPADLTDVQRAELQRAKADALLAKLEEAQATGDLREDERTARIRARLVSYQPPGESEFRDFTADELDALLSYELPVAAFERALLDASRGIVAKN